MSAALPTSELASSPARHSFAASGGSGARSKFKTIVADPPWAYKSKMAGKNCDGEWYMHSAPMPYPTMTVDEICAIPIRELAEDDSHLYLWTTQSFLRGSYRVLDAWGYKQGALLVWSKPPKGVCGTYVCSVEFCIFARRGNLEAKRRQIGTCYQWPRSHHSAKPEAFQDMVESVSPGPYLELFARRQRLGWATWGNEALNHVELVLPKTSGSTAAPNLNDNMRKPTPNPVSALPSDAAGGWASATEAYELRRNKD